MASIPAHAQQPAYSILGEKEFSGVQIYDIIQDTNLNYWFATNEGIVYYDYHTFENIDCKDSKGPAFFNLVMNSKGTLYCHNLNNQIFEIKDKKCRLFYELKPDEAFPDISIIIDDSDNLVIGAQKILALDESGKIVYTYGEELNYLSPGFKLDNGSVLFHSSRKKRMIICTKDSVYTQDVKFVTENPQNQSGVLLFFRSNGKIVAIDKENQGLYRLGDSGTELILYADNPGLETGLSARVYETQAGSWTGGTNFGIDFFEDINKPGVRYFQSYFISNVYQDAEGNILLGTFDKGILVVPDMKIPDVIESFTSDPVTALYADAELGIFMGTSTGKLWANRENGLNPFQTTGSRNIQGIYGSEESPFILFDNGTVQVYHKTTRTFFSVGNYALKGAAMISETAFYMGTSAGVIKIIWKGRGIFETEIFPELSMRVFSVTYDPAGKYLYVATANGLFLMDSMQVIQKIRWKGQDVFPVYLHADNGKIYASGNGNEVLVISGNQVEKTIQVRVDGRSQLLTKVKVYKNTLLGSSSSGLFQFDLEGNVIRYLHSVFQFPSRRVIDFTLDGDDLWVSHLGGVQKLDLKYTRLNSEIPQIRFDKIRVNEEETDIFQNGYFTSSQRKFEFIVSSPTLKNQSIVRYYYKLEGYDSEWQIQTHEFNQITYNALAPGNYKLWVKAEVEGVFSEPVSYSFRISAPFYARWWFIVSVSLAFILLVFLVYKRQLSIQQRKAKYINELNASKLVAIQSQMNPHFIFNSLNSIQDLVLKGDIDNSYTFITKFSNLVRRTLNYSAKDFIEFDQEIKLIELYLSLEKLRFKDALEYTLEVNSVEDIFIPPMLIQPFIENALLHGLLHKEGIKKLQIRFRLEECLICEIEDNGVGRVRAREIKLRQNSEYESFSGTAIKRRFELLSQHFKGELGFRFEDLYADGIPVGTRVILSIPVKRRF